MPVYGALYTSWRRARKRPNRFSLFIVVSFSRENKLSEVAHPVFFATLLNFVMNSWYQHRYRHRRAWPVACRRDRTRALRCCATRVRDRVTGVVVVRIRDCAGHGTLHILILLLVVHFSCNVRYFGWCFVFATSSRGVVVCEIWSFAM